MPNVLNASRLRCCGGGGNTVCTGIADNSGGRVSPGFAKKYPGYGMATGTEEAQN
jgi:hypothetical protein